MLVSKTRDKSNVGLQGATIGFGDKTSVGATTGGSTDSSVAVMGSFKAGWSG